MNNTAAGPGHAPRPVRHKDLPATLYGIRHHGPGSARSVRAALAEQRPDVVLIEGPPEADGLVALAADEEMRPPVALLGYVPGEPQQAAFWPFAVFSPEWQAIGYALRRGRPGPVLRPAGRAPARDGRPRCPAWRAPIPSPSWPPRPGTTTRSAGGRTWWSMSRARLSSMPWPKPSGSSAPTPQNPIPATRSARRTCGRCCAGRSGTASSGSRWSAAPGTCRPCATCRPRSPMTGCCAACRRRRPA